MNKSNLNISFLIAFDHSFSFLVLNIKTLLINVNVYMFPYQCEPFMGKYENKCIYAPYALISTTLCSVNSVY